MKRKTLFVILLILSTLLAIAPAALAAAPQVPLGPQPGCYYPGPYHLGLPIVILACVSAPEQCPAIVSGPAELVRLVCLVTPALHR